MCIRLANIISFNIPTTSCSGELMNVKKMCNIYLLIMNNFTDITELLK